MPQDHVYMGENARKFYERNEGLRPINVKRSIAKEGRICVVCAKKCSQLCKCMACRQWTHVQCLVDGVCSGGCKDQPQ